MDYRFVSCAKFIQISIFTLLFIGCNEDSNQQDSNENSDADKADFWGVAEDGLCRAACDNWNRCEPMDEAGMEECLESCHDLDAGKAACLALRDMSEEWTCDEEIEYCLNWYEPSEACVDACAAWNSCESLDGDNMTLCIADCETWRTGAAECMPQRDMSDDWTCDEEIEYCLNWYEPGEG